MAANAHFDLSAFSRPNGAARGNPYCLRTALLEMLCGSNPQGLPFGAGQFQPQPDSSLLEIADHDLLQLTDSFLANPAISTSTAASNATTSSNASANTTAMDAQMHGPVFNPQLLYGTQRLSHGSSLMPRDMPAPVPTYNAPTPFEQLLVRAAFADDAVAPQQQQQQQQQQQFYGPHYPSSSSSMPNTNANLLPSPLQPRPHSRSNASEYVNPTPVSAPAPAPAPTPATAAAAAAAAAAASLAASASPSSGIASAAPSNASSSKGGAIAKARVNTHTGREPVITDYTSPEEYQAAWTAWRQTRDANNEAVRRSRSAKRATLGCRNSTCLAMLTKLKSLHKTTALLLKASHNPQSLTRAERRNYRALIASVNAGNTPVALTVDQLLAQGCDDHDHDLEHMHEHDDDVDSTASNEEDGDTHIEAAPGGSTAAVQPVK